MFIFLKMMQSQNDLNKCFRGLKNQNFLYCPTMVGRLFENFLKNLFLGFCTLVMESLNFFENKGENSLNFSLYHHQQGAKSLIDKKKLKRAIVCATG